MGHDFTFESDVARWVNGSVKKQSGIASNGGFNAKFDSNELAVYIFSLYYDAINSFFRWTMIASKSFRIMMDKMIIISSLGT